jgi:hypothetical protein
MIFWAFINIISAFADALCADRHMNVNHFRGMFSTFNFRFGDGDFSIKKKQIH